jgi:hypothetical protein
MCACAMTSHSNTKILFGLYEVRILMRDSAMVNMMRDSAMVNMTHEVCATLLQAFLEALLAFGGTAWCRCNGTNIKCDFVVSKVDIAWKRVCGFVL